MLEESGGWWRADVPDVGAGAAYSFLLDDDETPLPDPRSLWQPSGVHSASRLYDHDAFFWTDRAGPGRQLPGSVLYECHIGTFTEGGTFDSAIEKLDHLVALGHRPGRGAARQRRRRRPQLGLRRRRLVRRHRELRRPGRFKRFVDACHARGLGVVLDVVYNHMGPSGRYLDRFAPYFAGETVWGPTVNLDGAHSEEVRRYVIDNALMWLRDYHLDGLAPRRRARPARPAARCTCWSR
jgi:maltooligosyltrehalose trehalohydrolase